MTDGVSVKIVNKRAQPITVSVVGDDGQTESIKLMGYQRSKPVDAGRITDYTQRLVGLGRIALLNAEPR